MHAENTMYVQGPLHVLQACNIFYVLKILLPAFPLGILGTPQLTGTQALLIPSHSLFKQMILKDFNGR